MRKTLASCFLLVLCQILLGQYRPFSYQDLDDSETVKSMKNHVSFLTSPELDGRAAASEGERKAARYLSDVFAQYGLQLLSPADGEYFGLRREEGDTLTSRNVLAVVEGYDKSLREHYIVVGARMDGMGAYDMTVNGESVHRIYPGAVGNAAGMALLLELARMIQTHAAMLGRSVLFAGFGSSAIQNAGSWYFLNRTWPDRGTLDAMISLEGLGLIGGSFSAYCASNRDLSALIQAMKSKLQPIHPELTVAEPFGSDHRSFYEQEIPSLLFSSGAYPERNSLSDTLDLLDFSLLEKQLEYIYSYIMELSGAPTPRFRAADPVQPATKAGTVLSYYECDYRPTFLGSSNPETFLKKWVYPYLKYPEDALKNGVQGQVTVDFVIDENGHVRDARVLRGVSESLDAEALRVIQASPTWKPARQKGKKVAVRLALTLEFRLEKKGSFGINGKKIK